MTDIELVRKCLTDWRSFAQGFRYAGLMDKLKQTQEALEALGRIAQPRFEWIPRDEREEAEKQQT